MDAELAAILQNIKSLADQATQMSSGEAMAPEGSEVKESLPPDVAEKVLKYLKEMNEGEGEEKEVEKTDDKDEDDIEKSAEGPTANDKAEERIDETTDVNEENIKEVAKAIMKAIGKKSVNKSSVKKSVDTQGLKELTTVVKALMEEVKVQKEFNTNILKGLGIADEILASSKVEAKPKSMPVVADPQEVAKSLAYIQSILGVKPETNEVAPGTNGREHVIAKSLADNDGAALKLMFAKNSKR